MTGSEASSSSTATALTPLGTVLTGAIAALGTRGIALTNAAEALAIGLADAEDGLTQALAGADRTLADARTTNGKNSKLRKLTARTQYDGIVNGLNRQWVDDATTADSAYAVSLAHAVRDRNVAAAASRGQDLVDAATAAHDAALNRDPSEYAATITSWPATLTLTRYALNLAAVLPTEIASSANTTSNSDPNPSGSEANQSPTTGEQNNPTSDPNTPTSAPPPEAPVAPDENATLDDWSDFLESVREELDESVQAALDEAAAPPDTQPPVTPPPVDENENSSEPDGTAANPPDGTSDGGTTDNQSPPPSGSTTQKKLQNSRYGLYLNRFRAEKDKNPWCLISPSSESNLFQLAYESVIGIPAMTVQGIADGYDEAREKLWHAAQTGNNQVVQAAGALGYWMTYPMELTSFATLAISAEAVAAPAVGTASQAITTQFPTAGPVALQSLGKLGTMAGWSITIKNVGLTIQDGHVEMSDIVAIGGLTQATRSLYPEFDSLAASAWQRRPRLSTLASWRKTETVASVVRVYRVEGDPNSYVTINSQGRVTIKSTNKMIFFNFDSEERALKYLKQKLNPFQKLGPLPGAKIKSFEVRKTFLDELNLDAVDEDLARAFPDSPIRVDITKAPNQFGLPPEYVEAMRQAIIQGNGRNGP